MFHDFAIFRLEYFAGMVSPRSYFHQGRPSLALFPLISLLHSFYPLLISLLISLTPPLPLFNPLSLPLFSTNICPSFSHLWKTQGSRTNKISDRRKSSLLFFFCSSIRGHGSQFASLGITNPSLSPSLSSLSPSSSSGLQSLGLVSLFIYKPRLRNEQT